MAPPSFKDLGKKASDIFKKDFPTDATLEISRTTANGIKFTANATKDQTGAILSDLKAKYLDKPRGIIFLTQGLSFTQTWTPKNVSSNLEFQNIAKGTTLELIATLPQKNTGVDAKAVLLYNHFHLFTKSSVNLATLVETEAVIGVKGYTVGVDAAYNARLAKMDRYNVAVAYIAPEFSVSLLTLNKLAAVSATYHQTLSSTLETATEATWAAIPTLKIGAKLSLDADSFLKAKVDNLGILGVGYSKALKNGLRVCVGGLFDTTRIGSDVHKFGVQFTYEA